MLVLSATPLLGFTAQYASRTGARALAVMIDAPVVDFSGAPKLQQDGTFEGYNAEGNKIVTDGTTPAHSQCLHPHCNCPLFSL